MEILFICLILSLFIWIPLIGMYLEKKRFNHGICIKCGKKLKLFDCDSQDGRGYYCDNCYYSAWVSYNSIDKNYKGEDNKMFDATKVKNECVQWIRNWFAKNGPECKAVIGISGGKDSSVVAALCVEALGKDRVVGVLMPQDYQADIMDSHEICDLLGIEKICINIGPIVDEATKAIQGNMRTVLSNQAKINLPPRIRMTTLYAVSQTVKGRVACTDNASEAYIGYSTRWGDNIGDFAPLVQLTSDEVIAVGDACGLPFALTHKTPSDGLCGKTDEDNFGFTYAELNKYIRTGVCDNKEIKEKIIKMHNKNKFKLEPIPMFKINNKD